MPCLVAQVSLGNLGQQQPNAPNFYLDAPADAAKAEARGLLAGKHEHIDGRAWPVAGSPQRRHRRNRPDDPQRAVVCPRQGNRIGVRPGHHRACSSTVGIKIDGQGPSLPAKDLPRHTRPARAAAGG